MFSSCPLVVKVQTGIIFLMDNIGKGKINRALIILTTRSIYNKTLRDKQIALLYFDI